MHQQIKIFDKIINLEIGHVYVIFNNHLSESGNLDYSKKIFYLNLPYSNSIKIADYINNKNLSIDIYQRQIEKYALEFIKLKEVTDLFNQLVYAIISEIENYDALVIGTMGLAFENIKLLLHELINVAEKYKKVFVFVQDTPHNNNIILENVDKSKLMDFENWYINKSKDNEETFFFRQ